MQLELTKVIEKYFGADAGYLDISCLDVARVVMEAGWTKPVLCKDCKMECYCKVAQWLGEDGYCSYGERREGE